jgi:hypothetical protein
MRQYRVFLSCLLAILVLACFTSNSQAVCELKQVAVPPGKTVVFPAFTTPGLTGPPGAIGLCPSKYFKGCLCKAEYCSNPIFLLDWDLVKFAGCMGFPARARRRVDR